MYVYKSSMNVQLGKINFIKTAIELTIRVVEENMGRVDSMKRESRERKWVNNVLAPSIFIMCAYLNFSR